MNRICLTFDIDWAPEPVCQDLITLLDEAEVAATFFLTDKPDLTLPKRHERALHPDFQNLSSAREVTSSLLARNPEALGVRSHCLTTSAPLNFAWKALGLEYTSNYLLYGQPELRPVPTPQGVVEYPIFFMDLSWVRIQEGRTMNVDPRPLLEIPGLKVFDFHPLHLFLNTASLEQYERSKTCLPDLKCLTSCRHTGPGVADLFRELLVLLGPGDYTLGSLHRDWLAREGPSSVHCSCPALHVKR